MDYQSYLSHNVAVNLKRIRTSKGMSLDVLSEQTGVSKSMLAQIEKGTANPSLGVLGKITSGLRIEFQELIDDDLGEDEGQEIGQVAIQAVVHVLDLDRLGAVGLADAARRVEADVQQVGRRVVAEFELGDGLLGEAQHGGVARRGVEHFVVVRREFQAPFPRLVLVFPAFACENDVPVAGVEVASLFVERAPLGGDV